MAKLKVFAVRDSKAEAYMNPFFMRSRGEALRAFVSGVNDPQTQLCKFPADFTLFEIGEFDEESGDLVMLPTGKVSLGLALEFKQAPSVQADMFNAPVGEKVNS